MKRLCIISFMIAVLTWSGTQANAQQSSFTKNGQVVQYPHAPVYYHNGNSIVSLNVALDEIQFESAPNTQVDTLRVRSLGRVTLPSPSAARVRLSVPSPSIDALNSRAQAARTSSQQARAVVYREGHTRRGVGKPDVLINRILVKPASGTTINTLAAAYGFSVIRRALPNHFIFEVEPNDDSLLASLELANALYESGNTEFAQPVFRKAVALRRVLNDTLFPDLWHILNTRTDSPFVAGNDAKVSLAWDYASGLGVNVMIVDTGVAVAHPDLSPNARTDIDFDILDNDGDPTPFDSHGTQVAGVAAARGDNNLGVAGVAYRAGLVGVRLVEFAPTDAEIVQAMSYRVNVAAVADQTHINSNSWGPDDNDPGLKEALTPAMEAALLDGVTNGRNGKGVIYVWAAGNGRGVNQNINYDGFASSRFTIAVGASGGDGKYSSYSEPGASMVLSAPSSFLSESIVSTSGSIGYTSSFGGTSAAAPLVSGVVALMLQVNPNLTWREVQKILIITAQKIDLTDPGWIFTGSNSFNHSYGFGRVHAKNAVLIAASFTSMDPPLPPLTASETGLSIPIPDDDLNGITRNFVVSSPAPFRAEQVELTVNITHPYRGDLVITLKAPNGATSILSGVHNDSGNDYSNWKFTSVLHFGTNPVGTWTLRIADGNAIDVGTLQSWSATIYGGPPHVVGTPSLRVPFFENP